MTTYPADNALHFTILGEPASKANSRRIVKNARTGQPQVIKSRKGQAYAQAVQAQCPRLPEPLEGDLSITVTAFYASNRPDLDLSILFDALQGRVYKNDRQLREQHLYHDIDRDNPRCVVTIMPRIER